MLRNLFVLLLLLMILPQARSQILISLLLGDKLNSDRLEFGLDGGLAAVNTSDRESSHSRLDFNLGFYFNIQVGQSKHWFLHTGFMGKSPAGTRFLDPYPLNEPTLDALLADGSITRKISYFTVPVYFRYRFDGFYFLEVGPQVGLLYKATDLFYADIKNEHDLVYTNRVRSQFSAIDFGFTAGLGYQFLQGEGISLGLRYYHGLTDIYKDNGREASNRIVYLFTSIPIGANKQNVK